MKLDISKLLEGSIDAINLEEKVNIGILDTVNRDVIITKPVSVVGGFYKSEDGIYLSAHVTYTYKENCARCLKEFSKKIETPISSKLVEDDKDVETKEDVIRITNNKVDFKDLIITSILLSLPMKSLCTEGCKGLCRHCGKDLNIEQCNCNVEDVDPRLAKLKELMD